MPLIALTGGIAAGKSTVAGRLAELGAVVVDADRLSRQAVEVGSPGLRAVAERFGDSVIAADGSLDRPALGAVIFSDEAARADLNAIVHPEVSRLSHEAFEVAFAEDPDRVVVYDVPLLAESRGAGEFDAVVVVHAPAEERIRRLIEIRGMTPAEAVGRVRAQADDATRLALADHVIDSSESVPATLAATDTLWPALVSTVRR